MSHGLRFDGPASARWTLVLAHGAGAPMDSPFMDAVAAGLAAAGVRTVRFEFPYMAARRETGRRAGPNRMPALLEAYGQVLAAIDGERIAIGGKSMGGRVASLLAADGAPVHALVCLGYPFHPPGKPEKLRTAHLAELAVPTLIAHGTRDPFGRREEVATYTLAPTVRLAWIEDGDHSFKPRVRSGRTLEQNLDAAVRAVADFLAEQG